VRAIPADLCTREQNLEAEVGFDLLSQPVQRLPEKLFDFAAAQANYVRVFLLEPRLVVVLVSAIMHQVQLIHQPAALQHLERAIDRHAIQLRIFLLR